MKEKVEDRVNQKTVNRMTYITTTAKRKRTKGQTMSYKKYTENKDRATRTLLKPGVNSGAPEG